MQLFRLSLVFFLCLLVGTQGQPVLRSVLRGAGGVVRSVGKVVGQVGTAVGGVVDSVGSTVQGVGDEVGAFYGSHEGKGSAALASAAESLEQIAKQGNTPPQITIQQIQQADAQ